MSWTMHCGDCVEILASLPEESVNCCVTSPPFWGLRDYGMEGQFGLEETPEGYTENLVRVFREVRRVLRDDGTAWLNLGDSYAGGGRAGKNPEYHKRHTMFGRTGHDVSTYGVPMKVPQGLKPKDLVGIPWRVAFALQADGWYLRQDIIWHKPNPMPESVTDRCTKSHEYLFLLSKNSKYYYDHEAVKESGSGRASGKHTPDKTGAGKGFEIRSGFAKVGDVKWHTRNRRSVWTVATRPFKGAHFAVFPPKLIEPCILAGCPEGGTVLDPFGGAGTTALVAEQHGRNSILIELNPEYVKIARSRLEEALCDSTE